jgi:hypothetical protein
MKEEYYCKVERSRDRPFQKRTSIRRAREREGPDLTFLDLAAHKGRRSLFQNGTVSRKTIPEWNKHQQSN